MKGKDVPGSWREVPVSAKMNSDAPALFVQSIRQGAATLADKRSAREEGDSISTSPPLHTC